MAWYQAQGFEFTSQHEHELQEVGFKSKNGPGMILHDFDVLLSYIIERKMRVTGMLQLPLKTLPEINERLAHPIRHGLKRPQQKSYPPIHGLYLLLRASGLTYVDETAGEPLLLIDDKIHQVWQSLNPTEQYGNLLESWCISGDTEMIGGNETHFLPIPENFHESLYFLTQISHDGLQITGNADVEDRIRYILGMHNLGLLMLFGCIDVQYGSPKAGAGWQIERIFRTPFGEALFALLQTEFFSDLNKIRELEDEREIPFGVLQPILNPYFPEWKNNLILPTWSSRDGIHVIKVSLGRLWRHIALPAGASLDILAAAILDSISFDHDHLYRFSYKDRSGIQVNINHPVLDEGPWTNEISVGDVPIRVGHTLTFLYDFGDFWEFDVSLECVDIDMNVDKPIVIGSHCKPPVQYPVWDEDEW